MIKDIKYNKLTTFTGRNGMFKQSGLSVTINGGKITLEPLTSRGMLGNCQINIPYGNIDQVINALTEALFKIENQ